MSAGPGPDKCFRSGKFLFVSSLTAGACASGVFISSFGFQLQVELDICLYLFKYSLVLRWFQVSTHHFPSVCIYCIRAFHDGVGGGALIWIFDLSVWSFLFIFTSAFTLVDSRLRSSHLFCPCCVGAVHFNFFFSEQHFGPFMKCFEHKIGLDISDKAVNVYI